MYNTNFYKYSMCNDVVIMKTAKQLKDKYEKDLKDLQETCKHEKVSNWLSYGNVRIRTNDRVKQCEICWTYLQRKLICGVCHKEYIIEEKEYRSWDQLCPECSKQGKYYCWQHKKFYNDPQGCSKCLEWIKQIEKRKQNV